MTSLAAPENLLALLVAHPGGVPETLVRASLGDTADPAATALRARGHDLQYDADRWRLSCAPQHFDPVAFARARRGPWGAPCEVWEVTGSTNDLARAGALGGAPEGALWIAEEQTAGRGRQGRTWCCGPHAGILASWIVRTPLAAEACPTLLPLAVGLGICEGLRSATGLAVRTKWPNDLWLEGAKLAGILVEARPGPQGFAVVGLGLNVYAEPQREAQIGGRSAHLALCGSGLRREALLAALLAAAAGRVEEWRTGNRVDLLARWRQLDVTQGRAVRVECGGETIAGRVVGIGESGCLAVETAAGPVREFAAGEVHLS